VCGGPDALLTSLNLRRAAEAAVSRRALILHELPLTADAAQAKAAVGGAGRVVVFLSAEFWSNDGAVAALRAAARPAGRRRVVAFYEGEKYAVAVEGKPAEFAWLDSYVVAEKTERCDAGNQRSGQIAAFIQGALEAVQSDTNPDEMLPPPPLPNQLEAVLAGPRDAAVTALLFPPPLPAAYAAAAVAAAVTATATPLVSPPPVVILSGAGGSGKSTAAAAATSDPRIVSAFDDIAWVTLGQATRSAVLRAFHTLLRALETPGDLPPDTLERAIGRLHDVCASRRVLLVVEDVWDADAALPFIRAVGAGDYAERAALALQEMDAYERFSTLPVPSSSVLFTARFHVALAAAAAHKA
jgi:hypothetical protein